MSSIFLKQFSLVGLFIIWTLSASAQALYDGANPNLNAPISIEKFAAGIPKGSIVVIGEQHNYLPIQQGQLSILYALKKLGHNINVGMEFLNYPNQSKVDDYRSGKLSEEDFKKQAWGESDFKMYRDQILFPLAKNGEKTFAINSPKEIPIAVKTKGLANLTDQEKSCLPPQFQLGSDSYKERFKEQMAGHVGNEEAMNRYFEAQSVWDDTMAWKICEAATNSNNTLVVIVGQFHVEYGDALISRIHARCPSFKVTSVFQYLFFNDEKIDLNSLMPSPKYGPLSDYLMVVQE
ncbi:MAG: ChaN family lipoprotein [Pseudobdellovibrionaceae bacterium]